MPLATVLNTNEIKNSAGTEVEFTRKSAEGSTVVYAVTTEAPNREHRFKVQHQEIGAGVEEKRRSNIQFWKQITGASGTPRLVRWSLTGELPIGDIADYTEPKNVLAELMSFVASTGADSTIKFDCTGNGADALVNGNT